MASNLSGSIFTLASIPTKTSVKIIEYHIMKLFCHDMFTAVT